jgi:hypothetical protein
MLCRGGKLPDVAPDGPHFFPIAVVKQLLRGSAAIAPPPWRTVFSGYTRGQSAFADPEGLFVRRKPRQRASCEVLIHDLARRYFDLLRRYMFPP